MSNQILPTYVVNAQFQIVKDAFVALQRAISASALTEERRMFYRRRIDHEMAHGMTQEKQLAALQQISLDLCIEKGLVSE